MTAVALPAAPDPGAPSITAPAPPARPTPGPSASTATTNLGDINLNVKNKGGGGLSSPLTLVLLLGAISFIPAVLMMVTAFTRIVIVLGLTRSALNTQGVPPNQVIIGLALFLTMFVMAPVMSKVNHDAIQPYMHGQIKASQAYDRGLEPVRAFMLKQVRDKDLGLMVKLSGDKRPAKPQDVATTTLVPAYVLSELRAAFLIGFVIFVPFIVIDLVVASALSAMGMVMVPPALISLPFKLLLFVTADGWYLVVESLVKSFH